MTLLELLQSEVTSPRTWCGYVTATTSPHGSYSCLPCFAGRRRVFQMRFDNYRCIELVAFHSATKAEKQVISNFAQKLNISEYAANQS